jgi:hypothetical protein
VNHEGAGHQLKLDKATATDTASLLFQRGYSGRAAIGTADDDYQCITVFADGTIWHEALTVNRLSGAVRSPGGLIDATTQQRPVLLLPSTVRDIWRSNADCPDTPRAFTIANSSASTLTLATNDAEQLITSGMHNVAMVRVWKISKSPAQPVWIDWQLAHNQVRVTDAAQIAGWTAGETLRLGDLSPTGTNTLNMFAIDLSRHLLSARVSVFRQRGFKLSVVTCPRQIGPD